MKARVLLLCCATAFAALSARADEHHYKNLLIGERASGLGGAFTAIADDPSGVYYNPAGMAFSFENYISLSANAYNSTSTRYKNIANGQDYLLRSSALIPAFFGFTQAMGRNKIAFSVIVPDSSLFDQDNRIENIGSVTDGPGTLTRRFFMQDTTYLIGPSWAREIFKNFSVGVSAFLKMRFAKSIDNQVVLYNPVGTGKYSTTTTYVTQENYASLIKIGAQYMPVPKWSIGLSVSRPYYITSHAVLKNSQSRNVTNGTASGDLNGHYDNDIDYNEQSGKIYLPEPFTVSLGNAYFFSKSFLISADLEYATPDSAVGAVGTYNWAVGAEWYATASFPIRIGFYSDNSIRAEPKAGASRQSPHVNLLGVTTGVSYVMPSSSFSLGLGYTRGSGKGQITSDQSLQDVEMAGLSIFIMGSYQL